MTALTVLLIFAIIMNMFFVYIAWQLLVLLQIAFPRLNMTLSDIASDAKQLRLKATEISKSVNGIAEK